MKKQIPLLPFTCLISIAFLVSSCGPSTITTNLTTKTALSTTQVQTITTSGEKPQYGGTLTTISVFDVGIFDSVATGQAFDPVIEAAHKEIQQHVIVDMPEANRLFRELIPYFVEQAFYIPLPSSLAYSMWWPWLKNYPAKTGFNSLNIGGCTANLKRK